MKNATWSAFRPPFENGQFFAARFYLLSIIYGLMRRVGVVVTCRIRDPAVRVRLPAKALKILDA